MNKVSIDGLDGLAKVTVGDARHRGLTPVGSPIIARNIRPLQAGGDIFVSVKRGDVPKSAKYYVLGDPVSGVCREGGVYVDVVVPVQFYDPRKP